MDAEPRPLTEHERRRLVMLGLAASSPRRAARRRGHRGVLRRPPGDHARARRAVRGAVRSRRARRPDPAGARMVARAASPLLAPRDRRRRRLRRGWRQEHQPPGRGPRSSRISSASSCSSPSTSPARASRRPRVTSDYAISPALFHWETQAAASVTRPSGRRYVDSATNGWSFLLFTVSTIPRAGLRVPRPGRYESHAGERPIAITWRLMTPMPVKDFEAAKVVA